jgi:hypothetical protein
LFRFHPPLTSMRVFQLFASALSLCFSALPAFAQEEALGAELVSEGWKHKVWLSYPPEKFRAGEVPRTEGKAGAVLLSAARGEVEPFLLVLRPEVPLRGVEARLSELVGPGGAVIPAPTAPARHLGYVFMDEPSGTRMGQKMPFSTGTGLYPDPLLAGAAEVRPQKNLQFWVAVTVPRNAVPGVYKGEVRLTCRKEGWMPEESGLPLRLPVELTVRRFALPEPSPLRNTAYFSTGQLPKERLTPEWLGGLYRDFAAHRHTPEPLLPSPRLRVLPGPVLEVDLSAWESAAEAALEQLHRPQIFLPVSGSKDGLMQGLYFLWHYPAICGQRWPAFPLPGQPGPFVCTEEGALSDGFRTLFGAYLRAANAVVERRGWAGRVFVSTMDEPYTAHVSGAERVRDVPAKNYPIIRAFAELVRENAPALRTFCTSNPVSELAGAVDQWCARNLDDLAKLRGSEAAAAGGLVLCDNYRTFIDYPMVSARTLGWLCWRSGARGWLTFETLGELGRAWTEPVFVYPQFRGGTAWGLGQLFYPEPLGTGLVPSVRWEMLRKGAEDYEYLWLLSDLLKGLPDEVRTGAAAQEAAAFLEHAAEGVAGAASEIETTGGAAQPNAQRQSVPHALRERAAAWIERLTPPGR